MTAVSGPVAGGTNSFTGPNPSIIWGVRNDGTTGLLPGNGSQGENRHRSAAVADHLRPCRSPFRAVPEPSTLALGWPAAAGLAAWRRRRTVRARSRPEKSDSPPHEPSAGIAARGRLVFLPAFARPPDSLKPPPSPGRFSADEASDSARRPVALLPRRRRAGVRMSPAMTRRTRQREARISRNHPVSRVSCVVSALVAAARPGPDCATPRFITRASRRFASRSAGILANRLKQVQLYVSTDQGRDWQPGPDCPAGRRLFPAIHGRRRRDLLVRRPVAGFSGSAQPARPSAS